MPHTVLRHYPSTRSCFARSVTIASSQIRFVLTCGRNTEHLCLYKSPPISLIDQSGAGPVQPLISLVHHPELLRNTPLVEDSIDYRMIVQEWPPIGSDFTARGGYITPNQISITRNMRERVRTLKRDYEREAERQVHEQANRVRPLLPRVPRDEEVPTEEQVGGVSNRIGDDARDTTECTTLWEPPLSVSDPRYVPHSRHNRSGPRSDGQRTSGGHNRANQSSGS